MPVEGSILESVREAVGAGTTESPFDNEIKLHINAVLSDLNQLGVGPDPGFEIIDETQTWEELTDNDARLNQVKQYVVLAVKLRHDPPDVGYLVTAAEKSLEKMEWRISVAADEIKNPVLPEIPEEGIIDGGIV